MLNYSKSYIHVRPLLVVYYYLYRQYGSSKEHGKTFGIEDWEEQGIWEEQGSKND